MRWYYATFIGVVCAALGTLLAFYFGDLATRAHHVSDFEGGRGYFVVFLLGPAGLVAGLVIGIVAARLLPGAGGAGFLRALGAGLVATAAVIAAAGGLAVLAAPRPPTLGGRALTLEFELRLPPGRTLPDSLREAGFTASVYSGARDNRFADVQFDRVGRRDGRLVIPGRIDLATQEGGRTLMAGVDFDSAQVWRLPLAGRPGPGDETWCAWQPASQHSRLENALADADRWELRYRVVPDSTAAGQ